MAYSRKDAGGTREFYGNFLVNSQYMHKVYQVRSTGEGKPTVFKAFASVHPDGSFAEQVVPVDGNPLNGISDAFHCNEMVNWMGKKGYQLITDTSDFPSKASPCTMFRQKIQEFIKKKGEDTRPEWSAWLKFKGGLNAPECKMMAQGVLLALDGEPCKNKERKTIAVAPVLLIISRSGTTDLEKKLTTPVDSSRPISADNCLIGDITTPQTGATMKVEQYLNEENKERYRVLRGDPYPLDPAYVKKHFAPWDKLIRVETAAWQIARLVESFEPAAVEYAFNDDPDYGPLIPEIARGTFYPKKVSMAGAGAGLGSLPHLPPVQQAPVQVATSKQAYIEPAAPAPAAAPVSPYPPIDEGVEDVSLETVEAVETQPAQNQGRFYTPATATPQPGNQSTIMAALQEAKAKALAKK